MTRLLVLAALASSACSSGKKSGCTLDSDCPQGEICSVDATCITASIGCTSDSDCTTDSVCDTSTGQCVFSSPGGCMSDSECMPGETCDTTSHQCGFAGCKSDDECMPGETCETTTGMCTGSPTTQPSCHQCACEDLLDQGGCANVCDSEQNGDPSMPNFCNGVSALPQCARCLQDYCGAINAAPDPNDPNGCT